MAQKNFTYIVNKDNGDIIQSVALSHNLEEVKKLALELVKTRKNELIKDDDKLLNGKFYTCRINKKGKLLLEVNDVKRNKLIIESYTISYINTEEESQFGLMPFLPEDF
jgi:hypothetical protein